MSGNLKKMLLMIFSFVLCISVFTACAGNGNKEEKISVTAITLTGVAGSGTAADPYKMSVIRGGGQVQRQM